MKNYFKKAAAAVLAVLTFTSATSGVAASAASETVRAGFTYKTNEGYEVQGAKFILCEDKNGDGKFTKGIDDKSTYKVTSDENGFVLFKNLKPETTYFITQQDSEKALYTDKMVYPFRLKTSDRGKIVDLLDYLPDDVYIATPKIKAYLDYSLKRSFFNSNTGSEEIAEHHISNAVFAVCPDLNGDGVFTKGIDDTVMFKSTTNEGGCAIFDDLAVRKTYFITQVSASGHFFCDKNVYSFFIPDIQKDETGEDVGYTRPYNILDYLPPHTYDAKLKVTAGFKYEFYSENADEFGIEGTTFMLCKDVDNDGKFTKGIDDASVYKVVTKSDGIVKFKDLIAGERYFITQTSAREKITLNKNVYSFIIPIDKALDSISDNSDGNIVNLSNLLPKSATVVKIKK